MPLSRFFWSLRDQYTLEPFQLWQVTERLQVTPGVQMVKDPSRNPDDDYSAVFTKSSDTRPADRDRAIAEVARVLYEAFSELAPSGR